ncbi:MAG: TetR family transcriptional regulator [Terrimonas sp.]|nr:TetR family transcriptional regulator [Terrimonas sp.]
MVNFLKATKIDKTTEADILAAAKKVFIARGMYGARMQDIADEAGINKALLHYYFKNKEQLFEQIFMDAAAQLFPRINMIFTSDNSLFEKIESFCEEYITVVQENPYLPLFVLNEMNRDPVYFIKKLWQKHSGPDPRKFLEQIEAEVKKGNIRHVSPLHLLMNLLSMTIFPFMARPMFQQFVGLDEMQFRMAMEQRKKEIPAFIINAMKR